MEKKKVVASSSSSSFDHIFGPRVSSSSSSATTGLFTSIFPRPSAGMFGRQMDFASQGGHMKYQSANERGERSSKREKNSYHNEETEPPCNLSSSIYYGGQEKYSSTTSTTKDTVSRNHIYHTHYTYYKKDGEQSDSKSASRGSLVGRVALLLTLDRHPRNLLYYNLFDQLTLYGHFHLKLLQHELGCKNVLFDARKMQFERSMT